MNMQAQDLYLKVSDPNGKCGAIVSHHRVWDRERFITAQIGLHAKPEKQEDRRVVSIVTQADYRLANGYKPEHCHE